MKDVFARESVVKRALDAAVRRGVRAALARLTSRRFFEAGFKNGEPETLQESEDLTLSVRLFADGRYLEAATSDIAGLDGFMDRCAAAVRLLDPDSARALPDPEWTRGTAGDLGTFDPAIEAATRESLVELARAAEAAARAASADVFHAESTVHRERVEVVAASTAGWEGAWRATTAHLAARAYVRDGVHKKRVDWSARSSTRLADVVHPDTIGREAADRAMRARGASPVPTGTYDLLIDNRCAGWLVTLLSGPLSGRVLHRGQSFLAGRIGQMVASPALTLVDDPLLPGGLGSRPFDGEGLAAATRPIIEKGVLRAYLLDTYYGRKLGMRPTTGSFSNVVVTPGPRGPDRMMADIDKGLLVTRFLGGNSNSLTGDFSAGVGGFTIEKGKVARPVAEVNVAGRIQDLLAALGEVANDPYQWSSDRVPSILVRGVAVSGT